jgi:hypothetical protein
VARTEEDSIYATDRADSGLVARVTESMPAMRSLIRELGDARVRLVAEAVRDDEEEWLSATITVAIGGVSIVTDEAHVLDDTAALRALLSLPDANDAPPVSSLIWRNGSAAVLLHEAVGHAGEHDSSKLLALSSKENLPSWLHVDVPLRLRRTSFRDVPLPRMTTLVARQVNAPFEMPDDAIEVHLVAGGAYDPLTEMVTLDVAVATYRGARVTPFTIAKSRREVLASLDGAAGEPLRYPGVICSREGQELVVGSYAPVMVTR